MRELKEVSKLFYKSLSSPKKKKDLFFRIKGNWCKLLRSSNITKKNSEKEEKMSQNKAFTELNSQDE